MLDTTARMFPVALPDSREKVPFVTMIKTPKNPGRIQRIFFC